MIDATTATILAAVLQGYGAAFIFLMARLLGKHELAARRSPDHPLGRTRYLLLPPAAASAFCTPEQRALLRGDHPRHSLPVPVAPPIALAETDSPVAA